MPKIERKYLAHFLDAKFGVQIPFTVYNAGNRVKGTFDLTTFFPRRMCQGKSRLTGL